MTTWWNVEPNRWDGNRFVPSRPGPVQGYWNGNQFILPPLPPQVSPPGPPLSPVSPPPVPSPAAPLVPVPGMPGGGGSPNQSGDADYSQGSMGLPEPPPGSGWTGFGGATGAAAQPTNGSLTSFIDLQPPFPPEPQQGPWSWLPDLQGTPSLIGSAVSPPGVPLGGVMSGIGAAGDVSRANDYASQNIPGHNRGYGFGEWLSDIGAGVPIIGGMLGTDATARAYDDVARHQAATYQAPPNYEPMSFTVEPPSIAPQGESGPSDAQASFESMIADMVASDPSWQDAWDSSSQGLDYLHKGGMVKGPPQDVPIMAKGGEYVLNPLITAKIGKETLDKINKGKVKAEAIKKAAKKGSAK